MRPLGDFENPSRDPACNFLWRYRDERCELFSMNPTAAKRGKSKEIQSTKLLF